jgi:hypothetical protein
MKFINRLIKNLWEYLFLPIGVISIFSAIIGTIIGMVVCIAILPNLFLNHFNIQSHLLDILSLLWFSSVLGIFIILIYFNQEEKVKWYILLLHGILLGCLISIMILCINYPILILYVVLTVIVIGVIVIIIKTIKE